MYCKTQNSSALSSSAGLHSAVASLRQLLNEQRHLVLTFQRVTVSTLDSSAVSVAEMAAVLHDVSYVSVITAAHCCFGIMIMPVS
jgi:hypothetical protein